MIAEWINLWKSSRYVFSFLHLKINFENLFLKLLIFSFNFNLDKVPLKVLGTPTREQIKEMNPNYTEFKFPQIKAHPWPKVSSGQI